MEPTEHHGWYYNNKLPHFDGSWVCQHITYRLSDSVAQEVLDRLSSELQMISDDVERDCHKRRSFEEHLDAGHGSCVLREPEVADVIKNGWKKFDGERYDLLAWVIMPNHCHILIRQYENVNLSKVVQSWKSYTGRWMKKWWNENKRVPFQSLKNEGMWQREYWDRFIRDQDHFEAAINNIHDNPVKANLSKTRTDWK